MLLLLWHLTKFIRYRFRKLSSKQRAPGGCSFLPVRLAFPCSAPRGTYLSKMNDIAGPQWQLGGRRVRLRRSVETGEGAPSVRRNIYLLFFSCRKSQVLENCRSDLSEILPTPLNFFEIRRKLLWRFSEKILCVVLLGRKWAWNVVFSRFLTFWPHNSVLVKKMGYIDRELMKVDSLGSLIM